ncbi:LOW QUALITY PROTEIN: prostaglandin E2 receptor EP3 subtype-like [Narcine bancroftii]|uniref:LOW QUALITY PROTEIN: prostaglandin E2 receptor EP3 subtype-like n=1 Tax=Narcine bancroftii TaxID=1343680 RepID=UPI0038317FD2
MLGGANSSSGEPSHNSSVSAARCLSVSVVFPASMMVTGLVGNTLALLLASRACSQKENKKKKSFLLIIGALALTDLTGQLLISPVVISVYLTNRQWSSVDPSGRLCYFFGACMTTFGLCPLFLANAMAIERTLAIYTPHYYSKYVSPRLTQRVVLSIWLCVPIFALLPVVGVGQYSLQWPGTWCFIRTGAQITGNIIFASTFTALGLASLLVTLGCNVATIRGLLNRRRKVSARKPCERIAVETLAQLTGILCVLCVCWSPLLVLMLKMTYTESSPDHRFTCLSDMPLTSDTKLQGDCNYFLTAIRLASLNQILDPWVYLLLRAILLKKAMQVADAVNNCFLKGFKEIPATAEATVHLPE